MLQKFKKAAQELLPSKKVGHTVFACGLSILLLTGCGATHNQSLAPSPLDVGGVSAPASDEVRTLKAIEGLAKGKPFAVISFKDYKQAKQLLDDHNKRMKGKEDSFEAEGASGIAAEQYKKVILSASKDLYGNPVTSTQFARNFSRADFSALNNMSKMASKAVGPTALNYGVIYPSTPASLILLPNAEAPLDNRGYVKILFDNGLGFKSLTKHLPPKLVNTIGMYIAGHEVAHVPQKFEKRKPFGQDLRALKREVDADLSTVKLASQKDNDLSLIEANMNWRALSSVLAGDADHATQFELYKFYKEKNPSAKAVPVVAIEDMHRAMRGLWPKRVKHTIVRYEKTLLQKNANVMSDPSSEEYLLLIQNRKRVLKERYDAGLIVNPQSRILAKFALDADKYFQGYIDRGQALERKAVAKASVSKPAL